MGEYYNQNALIKTKSGIYLMPNGDNFELEKDDYYWSSVRINDDGIDTQNHCCGSSGKRLKQFLKEICNGEFEVINNKND